MNSILAAKLHFGLWCLQTSALGSIGTCLHMHSGFRKQNEIKLIHLLHLNHFLWPKSLVELMKDFKPNAALKLDTAHSSRSYFHQHINPLIALSVPQITAVSFRCAALCTLHAPLMVTHVKLMHFDSWALTSSSLLSTLHSAENQSLFPSCCGIREALAPCSEGRVCNPSPIPCFPAVSPAWDLSGLMQMFTIRCFLNQRTDDLF